MNAKFDALKGQRKEVYDKFDQQFKEYQKAKSQIDDVYAIRNGFRQVWEPILQKLRTEERVNLRENPVWSGVYYSRPLDFKPREEKPVVERQPREDRRRRDQEEQPAVPSDLHVKRLVAWCDSQLEEKQQQVAQEAAVVEEQGVGEVKKMSAAQRKQADALKKQQKLAAKLSKVQQVDFTVLGLLAENGVDAAEIETKEKIAALRLRLLGLDKKEETAPAETEKAEEVKEPVVEEPKEPVVDEAALKRGRVEALFQQLRDKGMKVEVVSFEQWDQLFET